MAPRAIATPQIPTESVLRLYLLSVATAGIYLTVWCYRAARRLQPQSNRKDHAMWAGAVLFPPFACIVLFEFLRLAREDIGGEAEIAVTRRASLWVAPTVLMALVAALYFSRLGPLWSPTWLLLPLPFVLVQYQLNRAALRPDTPVGGKWPLEHWLWAVVAVGLPGVVALGYKLDRDHFRELMLSRSWPVGAAVTANDRGYSIVIPAPGWCSLPPRGVDGKDPDIALSREDGRAWMVSYEYAAAETSIDSSVDSRRQLISAETRVDSIDESRYFLKEADLVPVSLARFGIHFDGGRRGSYVVLTVAVDKKIYELVGYASDSDGHSEIMKLLMSFTVGKGTS